MPLTVIRSLKKCEKKIGFQLFKYMTKILTSAEARSLQCDFQRQNHLPAFLQA